MDDAKAMQEIADALRPQSEAVQHIANALVAHEATAEESRLVRDPLTGQMRLDFHYPPNLVHGNVADGLFAIAKAINRLADALGAARH